LHIGEDHVIAVLEDHQVFAEQPQRLDRPVAGKLVDQRRRLPVAPHEIAARRAGADAGDEVVLLGAHHGHTSPILEPKINALIRTCAMGRRRHVTSN
jgi:hypothetical protein